MKAQETCKSLFIVKKIPYTGTLGAPIAQLVEQQTLNLLVQGSIPCGRTILFGGDGNG